nr:phosphoribosylamine--glycine ligase [Geodermatophilaceae bacterium]
MRVLVIGSGAREHALCRALAADPSVDRVDCAPGNAGIAEVAGTHPLDVGGDPGAIVELATRLRAGLVVIGPEDPLVNGAVDLLHAAGIACFGPSAAAARIEGSKVFAKEVMVTAGVPTAGARECTDAASVKAALEHFGAPHVVKDDGLAAGKGVVVTADRAEALAHAEVVLAAGHAVVVEEYLAGPEVSLFAVTDGTAIVPLLPAQDFKRAGDGDTGPNTGGMGAYAPLPWLPADVLTDVLSTILQPTVAELARRDTPSRGLLYAGLV